MKTIIYMVTCALLFLAATGYGEDGADYDVGQEHAVVAFTNNAIPWLKASAPAPVLPEKATVSSWRSFGALLVVLGCLWAVTWFLKKRICRTGLIGDARRLRVIERLNLGQRQYLALVRVDGDEMLLGVSADQIVELTRNTLAQNCAAENEAVSAG